MPVCTICGCYFGELDVDTMQYGECPACLDQLEFEDRLNSLLDCSASAE